MIFYLKNIKYYNLEKNISGYVTNINMERYNILNKNEDNNIENKKKINVNLKKFRNVCKINIKFSAKFLFFLFIIIIIMHVL